ncbi:hypothetical protein [Streptomyces sp. NBC_00057]|uniref:hypothetical protein n=1 Tax=Streptomyces sp. NBC_00057 TaxID=2975634 RepID=UPI0032499A66
MTNPERAPRSRWEFAISAAEQLLLWHGRTDPQVLQEPLRTRSVVLLGACIATPAVTAGLDGSDVSKVPLADAATVLERYVASALESCRDVPDSVGGRVVDEILSVYGQPQFEEIRHVVRETLAHHMADSGPHVRIIDRRQALLDTGLQR